MVAEAQSTMYSLLGPISIVIENCSVLLTKTDILGRKKIVVRGLVV